MEFALISWQCGVISAAYFVAGIIDAVCGGGGLITVPALMLIGIPVHYVTGTNQCLTIPGNIVTLVKFTKSGNVHFRSGIIAAVTAILGGIVGAKLNILIPEKYLQFVMIALIPIVALTVFFKKDFGENDFSESLSMPKLVAYSCVVGFAGGAYQGFFGVGSGIFYILIFTTLIKLNLVRASGTTKLASFFAALSASITYAFSGLVIWRITILGMLLYSLGSWLGANLALKNGSKIIRPLILGVIALLFVKLIIDI